MQLPDSAAMLLARLTGQAGVTPEVSGSVDPAKPASAATGSTHRAPDSAAIADGAGEAARAHAEARFWRARAAGLEAELETVRTRLLQLARHLPLALAEHLGSGDDRLADLVATDDLLDGWVETTTLWPSSVGSELARLWSRLRRDDV